ncbi:bifunctional folylpolyglutamate synthase/dihydrofolate synthase [Lederbergia citrea]|uniref:bifunctional folylpolyglutamate synthase/dihydrofolate synthase n=1 Tax=Lederbergia citrea TaxID=2833581 RepID=UPI001BC9BFED|nr:folylpolyglutamate synthase/dihydrofolate synthase family protein [Lederbergia citrea]MBS4202741.1 bifunctional folylpolyglutamate synthase/dihydrofolate synthase [Lederbergia citrea]
MFHTYEEALDWIHSRLRFGIKPGLKRMEWMLEKLGHPERELKAIHVGGTNGKGSTVAYLRSILHESGYKVGTFTSPYIEQFNERISVNGNPIPDQAIIDMTNVIKPLADELEATELGSPTEFEVITAMAFYYFAKENPVDIAIFEVGLGGRYDSTNVIEPLVSIITNVGMDHTQILGNTIKDIAYEKAGIIKRNTPIFTAIKLNEALAVLQEEAKNKHAKLFQLGVDFFTSNYKPIDNGEQFTFSSNKLRFEKLELSLLGQHQTENAAGAIAALLYLNKTGHIEVKEEHFRAGLKKAYWPGRLELLSKSPTVLIDGAHNKEGLQAFAAAIKSRFQGRKINIVFAALKDKDLTEMFGILNSMEADLYLTQFDFPRAASAVELKDMSGNPNAKIHHDWPQLLKQLISSSKPDELIAVTGSLYFISEVKPYLSEVLQTTKR